MKKEVAEKPAEAPAQNAQRKVADEQKVNDDDDLSDYADNAFEDDDDDKDDDWDVDFGDNDSAPKKKVVQGKDVAAKPEVKNQDAKKEESSADVQRR